MRLVTGLVLAGLGVDYIRLVNSFTSRVLSRHNITERIKRRINFVDIGIY